LIKTRSKYKTLLHKSYLTLSSSSDTLHVCICTLFPWTIFSENYFEKWYA